MVPPPLYTANYKTVWCLRWPYILDRSRFMVEQWLNQRSPGERPFGRCSIHILVHIDSSDAIQCSAASFSSRPPIQSAEHACGEKRRPPPEPFIPCGPLWWWLISREINRIECWKPTCPILLFSVIGGASGGFHTCHFPDPAKIRLDEHSSWSKLSNSLTLV